MFSIAVYLSVTIPSMRTIVEPVQGTDTKEDRIEALRVLGAGNTIIIVLMGAILVLQVRSLACLSNTPSDGLVILTRLDKNTLGAWKHAN